ncbi:MAG: hypothetical protein ACRC8A_17360 [Microcoleaceae cyanobacterium]
MKLIYRGVHYESSPRQGFYHQCQQKTPPNLVPLGQTSEVAQARDQLIYRGVKCSDSHSENRPQVPMNAPYRFLDEKLLNPEKIATAGGQEVIYSYRGGQVRIQLTPSGKEIQNVFVLH